MADVINSFENDEVRNSCLSQHVTVKSSQRTLTITVMQKTISIDAGIQYSNTIQSMLPGSLNTGWTITNYIAANVSLLESWRSSQLAINYSGGGDFSTDKTIGNGYFQQLGFSQTFNWQRWQLVFLDQLAYLPQSNFGFGSGTGLGLPGGGINTGVPQTGVGSNGQTLFNAVGPRVSNNFTAQALYQLTPRSSMNVSGTYGIQRFVDAGNIDSNNYGEQLRDKQRDEDERNS